MRGCDLRRRIHARQVRTPPIQESGRRPSRADELGSSRASASRGEDRLWRTRVELMMMTRYVRMVLSAAVAAVVVIFGGALLSSVVIQSSLLLGTFSAGNILGSF